MDVRPAAVEPVTDRPVRRLEGDPRPGDRLGQEGADLERLRVQPRGSTHDAGLEGEDDDRVLEARIAPDDLAWLDDERRLLERLADGRLADRPIDLQEAAGLGPPAVAGLASAAEEDERA